MGRLDGKRALVTGASRGTGAAVARLFVEEGARVALADVNDAGGEELARELGPAARYLHLDVAQEDDWRRAVERTVEAFGGLDVLVNNAAVLHLAALEETSVEACERLFRVNQLGTFLGIRSVVAPMRAAGRGSIVNVSSVDGLAGKNGVAAYAATKWAVRGLTKVAAIELGRYGIRVNTVCPEAGSADMLRPYFPPGVDPELVLARQQPLLATQRGRTLVDRVGDVARAIAFLASDDAASCTGADLAVDGGNTAGRVVRGAPGA